MSFTTIDEKGAPALSEFRRRYPLTVAQFGSLGTREAWLRSIWLEEMRWRERLERSAQEVIVMGAPPARIPVETKFDAVYCGGRLGLLHAAVMAARYNRSVMVFDEAEAGRTNRVWNISNEDLKELESSRLFSKEEIEAAIKNRSRSGLVKFHDAASRVKSPPLSIEGVLDVAIDADELLARARKRIQESTHGSLVLDYQRFVRAYVEADRVSVEVEDARTGEHKIFAARLFVDASGASSPVLRQLRGVRGVSHVSPTVGTIARGFVRGSEHGEADFGVGEILVSKEDASAHRQLIWEALAQNPARDEYATCLFFYDAVDSPADKSLLALFERYFESLPAYKRQGTQWRVTQPLFGYAESLQQQHGWPTRGRSAMDRVMAVGDAASMNSPLAFNNFGAHVRGLQRQTHLTDLALEAEMLDSASLAEVSAAAPRVAQAARLAEFLRPTPSSAPSAVNETLNAVMMALHALDERVRRELFLDRLTLSAFKKLLSCTAKLYPRIFSRVREHLGARGMFWWLAEITDATIRERAARTHRDGQAATEMTPAQEFNRQVALYKKQMTE